MVVTHFTEGDTEFKRLPLLDKAQAGQLTTQNFPG